MSREDTLEQCQGSENDNVNKPSHYSGNAPAECIDVIESQKHLNTYHLGNAFKYLWRAGKKGEGTLEEDINKAAWYLMRWLLKNDPKRLRSTLDYFSEKLYKMGVE